MPTIHPGSERHAQKMKDVHGSILSIQEDRPDELQHQRSGKRNLGLGKNCPSENTILNTIDVTYHAQPPEIVKEIEEINHSLSQWHQNQRQNIDAKSDPRLRKGRVEPDEPTIKVNQPRRTLEARDGDMNKQADDVLRKDLDPSLVLKLRSLEDKLKSHNRQVLIAEKEYAVLHQLKSNTQAVKLLSTPPEHRTAKQQEWVEKLIQNQKERTSNPLLRGKIVSEVQQVIPESRSIKRGGGPMAKGLNMDAIHSANAAAKSGKRRSSQSLLGNASTAPYVPDPGAVVPKRAHVAPPVYRNLEPLTQHVERSFAAGRNAPTAKNLASCSKHIDTEVTKIMKTVPTGTKPKGLYAPDGTMIRSKTGGGGADTLTASEKKNTTSSTGGATLGSREARRATEKQIETEQYQRDLYLTPSNEANSTANPSPYPLPEVVDKTTKAVKSAYGKSERISPPQQVPQPMGSSVKGKAGRQASEEFPLPSPMPSERSIPTPPLAASSPSAARTPPPQQQSGTKRTVAFQ